MSDIPLHQPIWVRARPLLPVWGFTAALGWGALLCWAFVLRGRAPVPAPLRIPWPVFAAAFAAGHFAGIRFELQGQTHTIDLTDVALLAAIVFAGPGLVIAAAALGTVMRSVWVRRPVLKAAFNVALHAFAVTVAIACFRAVLGHAGVLTARGGLAAVVAVLAAETITHAGIYAVIAISTRRFRLGSLAQLGFTLLVEVGINTVVGLAAVDMLWTGWDGAVLFLVLAAGAGLGYVAFGRLRSRHTHLNRLHSFEQALATETETESVIATALQEALVLLHAETAQLICSDDNLCYTLRLGTTRLEVTDAPHPLAYLAHLRSDPVLAPKDVRDRELAQALRVCGFRDAMALRLPFEGFVPWVLVIADRGGERHLSFGHEDIALAEALTTPTAMALRSSSLLEQLHCQVALKHHEASHDGLTGLANRTSFSNTLDQALAERSVNAVVGVLLIDLDGFKKLNDSLGHEAGDVALETFAQRLVVAVGDAGTAGRLGGDEFAVVIPHPCSPAQIVEIAERIDRDARVPETVGGTSVQLRASIGVALAPLHGEDRFILLRQADLAMYQAKQAGGGVQVRNDRPIDYMDRPSLITALRETISASGLRLHYQPTVDFATGRINGVEALTRWTHPLYGPIGPDQFIPVAEASGLIGPLTRWALDTALAQAAQWHKAGFALDVAVNLSPEQLNDLDIVTQISDLLDRHRFSPSCLTLEITESDVLGQRRKDSIHVLESLSSLGVRVSLDDFGVGTSSLIRLKNLPVDQLKIDRSFTENLSTDPTDRAIVASTIKLAHQLGLTVTAEGVETDETYQLLHDLGCDNAQGYLVSPALDPSDLTHWLYDLASVSLRKREAALLSGAPPTGTSQPRWALSG